MALLARIGRLFRGFTSRLLGQVEERNPEALMEAARQDFRSRMALYTQALARVAGVAERLKIQIGSGTATARDLERRIVVQHQVGNDEAAGVLAREFMERKAELAAHTTELEQTEQAYQANLQQAQIVQRQFEEKIRSLQRQLSQVQVQEAQAEAAAALADVAFKVGDLGDTMKTVEEILARRYELSAGQARLARDFSAPSGALETPQERQALNRATLSEYLASRDAASTSPPASAPPDEQEKIRKLPPAA